MTAEPKDAATRELGGLVTELVQALSTDPSEVLVLARRDEGCVRVHVSAAEAQLGRLIGRNGKTAQALRRVVDVVASKHQVHCDLNIGPFAAGEAGK